MTPCRPSAPRARPTLTVLRPGVHAQEARIHAAGESSDGPEEYWLLEAGNELIEIKWPSDVERYQRIRVRVHASGVKFDASKERVDSQDRW